MIMTSTAHYVLNSINEHDNLQKVAVVGAGADPGVVSPWVERWATEPRQSSMVFFALRRPHQEAGATSAVDELCFGR